MRDINLHIVHCSDTPDNMDLGVKIIRQWHLKRKWKDIGYHFVIRRDGSIELGRPISTMGAHAKGYNKNSIGTCLVGRNEFTEEQFKSLKFLDNHFKMAYNVETIGHNEVNEYKTCPNFNVKEILKG